MHTTALMEPNWPLIVSSLKVIKPQTQGPPSSFFMVVYGMLVCPPNLPRMLCILQVGAWLPSSLNTEYLQLRKQPPKMPSKMLGRPCYG